MLLSRSASPLVSPGLLPAAHARFVEAMLASQFPRAALDYAEKALADRPGDATPLALRDRAASSVPRAPRRSVAPPLSSRWSHARARSQSRLTVGVDTAST